MRQHISVQAQTTTLQAREAEWKSYSLPQTNFARQMTPDKTVVFRVPDEWELGQGNLVFNGPHGSRISVTPADGA